MVNYTDILYWWYHADWTWLLEFSSYSGYLVKTNTWQRMENKSFQNSCVRKCWKITFKLNDNLLSQASTMTEKETQCWKDLLGTWKHCFCTLNWHFWLGPRNRGCFAKIQAVIQRSYNLGDQMMFYLGQNIILPPHPTFSRQIYGPLGNLIWVATDDKKKIVVYQCFCIINTLALLESTQVQYYIRVNLRSL